MFDNKSRMKVGCVLFIFDFIRFYCFNRPNINFTSVKMLSRSRFGQEYHSRKNKFICDCVTKEEVIQDLLKISNRLSSFISSCMN